MELEYNIKTIDDAGAITQAQHMTDLNVIADFDVPHHPHACAPDESHRAVATASELLHCGLAVTPRYHVEVGGHDHGTEGLTMVPADVHHLYRTNARGGRDEGGSYGGERVTRGGEGYRLGVFRIRVKEHSVRGCARHRVPSALLEQNPSMSFVPSCSESL